MLPVSRGRDGIRIGIDVGGTFTDCVVVDPIRGRYHAKAFTTPEDPALGVLDVLQRAAEMMGRSTGEILSTAASFIHGTTVGTNTLIERRGARVGLLMTKGHEETLAIGRVYQKVAGLSEREKTHVTHLSRPTPPIVHPRDVRPVSERIDSRGCVVAPLDPDAALTSVADLAGTGVEAIAICLLFSFLNPHHEQVLREAVRREFPDLYVCISSDVAPVLGEYERCVSTVLNAYIGRRVGEYLTRLERNLHALGMTCSLLVMQAHGGVTTVADIREKPLLTVDSGPAGGVLGAGYYGADAENGNIICVDVGGTSFDVGLLIDGRVEIDAAPVIAQYSYVLPKVYIKSIGAGGGSIAWLDHLGALRVGPRSAGVDPGPVSYGRGGTAPTVTDAHLVLGFLDPSFPLGGHVGLDKDAAERALAALGEQLGMTAPETASAVVAICNAQMADLVRKVTIERGLDPRRFAFFAYGGAGPMFAAFIAREIGSRVAYVAPGSGVFSALGMLTTDLVYYEEHSHLARSPFDPETATRLTSVYRDLEERVLRRFEREGIPRTAASLSRLADLRFVRQVNELEVPVSAGDLGADDVAGLEAVFVGRYERTYGAGSAYTAAGVELVKVRVVGRVDMEKPPRADPRLWHVNEAAQDTRVGEREILFPGSAVPVVAAIHSSESIRPGTVVQGPAVLQRLADTVVIPQGSSLEARDDGSLVVRWDAEVA